MRLTLLGLVLKHRDFCVNPEGFRSDWYLMRLFFKKQLCFGVDNTHRLSGNALASPGKA